MNSMMDSAVIIQTSSHSVPSTPSWFGEVVLIVEHLRKQGAHCRVVVATHPAGQKKSRIGVTREGLVYELFFTRLPQQGFTASDVVELYLHRGAFEPVLADEDREQDPDRWCSQSSCGQECWQCVSQWVWNLRLELGHQLHPDPVRTTVFAPACSPEHEDVVNFCSPVQGYGLPEVALLWKAGRCSQHTSFTISKPSLLLSSDRALLRTLSRNSESIYARLY